MPPRSRDGAKLLARCSLPWVRLVGRAKEQRVLKGLLDAARRSMSTALVVRGDPGMGKTAPLADGWSHQERLDRRLRQEHHPHTTVIIMKVRRKPRCRHIPANARPLGESSPMARKAKRNIKGWFGKQREQANVPACHA